MAKCIITGCALQLPDGYVWGDLFEEGDCFIFNGSGDVQYDEKFLEEKMLIVLFDYYFERRNVFVILKSKSTLNEKALKYISGSDQNG